MVCEGRILQLHPGPTERTPRSKQSSCYVELPVLSSSHHTLKRTKNASTNTLAAKGGLSRISVLCQIQGGEHSDQ